MTPKSLISAHNTRLMYSFFGRKYLRIAPKILGLSPKTLKEMLQNGEPFTPSQLTRILATEEERLKAVDQWRKRKEKQYAEGLDYQTTAWKIAIRRASALARQTLDAHGQLIEPQYNEESFIVTWRSAPKKRNELYTILASRNLKQNKLAERRAEVAAELAAQQKLRDPSETF